MAKASSTTLAGTLAEPITGDAKPRFHRKARALLKRLASALELPKDSYRIRTNRGSPAVSGEVMLQDERIAVQITQSSMGRDHDVLYRRCAGAEDHVGGANHFASAAELETDPAAFAKPAKCARARRDAGIEWRGDETASRMTAIAHALDDMTRTAAARLAGMDRQTLRDWVVR